MRPEESGCGLFGIGVYVPGRGDGALVVHVFVIGSYISVLFVFHPKTYTLPLTATTS